MINGKPASVVYPLVVGGKSLVRILAKPFHFQRHKKDNFLLLYQIVISEVDGMPSPINGDDFFQCKFSNFKL